MFFASFTYLCDVPGKLFISGCNQGRAESGHPGLDEISADIDQIVPLKIRLVEVNPGESVYLNVDEAGCYSYILIRPSLIAAA